MKLDDLKKSIDEWFESSESEIYFKKEKEKNDLLLKRFARFENWLKDNNFDTLIRKLIYKHGENYREKCYRNGHEPYPNNVLQFIFDYIKENYDDIDVSQLNCDFPNYIWFFRGYYFQIIFGQGSINRIYDKNFEILLNI